MKKRESFVFYRSFLESIEDLDVNTQNEFFLAISKYALDGILPQFDGLKQAVWKQIKYHLDKNITKYENCVKNGKKGGAPKGSNNNPNGRNQYSKDNQEDNLNVNVNVNGNPNVNVDENINANEKNITKSKRKAFEPPTLKEVENYIFEKEYYIDANSFYDYYVSNGWKVGRNQMKDWKAAVNNWNRKQGNFENKNLSREETKQRRDAEFANYITEKLAGD